MICGTKSKAEKVYQKRIVQTMSAYMVLVFATTYLVRHGLVTGWWLYVLAVVPAIPVLRLIHVVAMYLSEETDEFLRLQVVRSILCGTGAVLAISAVSDFLRSYTRHGDLPPFTVFVAFWIVFALSQFVQWTQNKAGSDDEPA